MRWQFFSLALGAPLASGCVARLEPKFEVVARSELRRPAWTPAQVGVVLHEAANGEIWAALRLDDPWRLDLAYHQALWSAVRAVAQQHSAPGFVGKLVAAARLEDFYFERAQPCLGRPAPSQAAYFFLWAFPARYGSSLGSKEVMRAR